MSNRSGTLKASYLNRKVPLVVPRLWVVRVVPAPPLFVAWLHGTVGPVGPVVGLVVCAPAGLMLTACTTGVIHTRPPTTAPRLMKSRLVSATGPPRVSLVGTVAPSRLVRNGANGVVNAPAMGAAVWRERTPRTRIAGCGTRASGRRRRPSSNRARSGSRRRRTEAVTRWGGQSQGRASHLPQPPRAPGPPLDVLALPDAAGGQLRLGRREVGLTYELVHPLAGDAKARIVRLETLCLLR